MKVYLDLAHVRDHALFLNTLLSSRNVTNASLYSATNYDTWASESRTISAVTVGPSLVKARVLTDAANFEIVDISAQISTGNKFVGAATAGNGKIVMAPRAANDIGVFDATDNSFELVDISSHISSQLSLDGKFSGAATATNGKIVMVPHNLDGVGVFDATDSGFQLVDVSSQLSLDGKFHGAATAANGKIIMAPSIAGGVGIFDPTDNGFELVDISSQVSGGDKFNGAVTAQNSKVVFAPAQAGSVGIFDPTDNSLELIDISSQVTGAAYKFYSLAMATNGKIVMAPTEPDVVGILSGLGSTTTTTMTTTSSTVTNTSTSSTVTTTSSVSMTTSTTVTPTSSTSMTSTTATTTSITATKTDSMTQVLQDIQASEQEALAQVLTLTSGTQPVIIDKPNAATVTVAQRIDVQAAADNGGFASIVVSGNVTDGEGGGEGNRVGAAVPVAMIRQLAASGGTGVVLMVSASKASATEETFQSASATGPANDDAATLTEPTLQITLAAPPVSVSIAVNGEIVNVRDLQEPILLTVLSKKRDGFACGFYNETTLEWSSEGMWEHDAGNSALVCASTHLTVFAAIKKTWVGLRMAVTCVPAEFLTAKGLSSIASSSLWRLVGAVSLCLFTVSQAWAWFLCQAYCDRKRDRPSPSNHEAVSFSHHFMSGRSAKEGGLLAQLQIIYNYVAEDLPRIALAPVKTLRLHLARDSLLQRVAKDLGPSAQELQIMLQWGQAERSRRESASSQHEEGLELNPYSCGAVLGAMREAGLRVRTWAPRLGCLCGEHDSDDLLGSVDRVQERVRQQLDEDAHAPPLPFKRFVRAHVGHPWMQAGESADEALLLTARMTGTLACAAYVSSVSSHSSASNDDCVAQDDLLLYVSKTLGVSLLAITGGSLACSALAFVGQRQGPCRKVAMWLLVNAYVCCCLLFCTAFIAIVLGPELQIWSVRASTSFIQMVVVFPLAQACTAHRMYYQCLQNEDDVRELRRILHLEGARRAWEDR